MIKNRMKQAIALLLALVLIASGMVIAPTQAEAANTVTFLHSVYTILPDGKTAEYVRPEDKTCTSIHIPAAIRINGKDYKVVSIRANACKNCKELIKATIGANVKKIGKKAFYGCKNLTELSIYSTKLTTKTVAKDAFKGTGKTTRWITVHLSKGKKGYVIVPKKKISQYKKVLKAGGADIKKWQFFYDEMNKYDPTEWTNYDPTQPLPDLEYSLFGLSYYYDKEINGNHYSKKQNIPVSARLCLDPHLYGDWVLEGTYCPIVHCNNCGRDFLGDMYAIHFSQMNCSMWYRDISDSAFNAWYFYPDDAPLKLVYEFTLPEGLSYNEDTVKVFEVRPNKYVLTQYCDTQVDGNKITVTIEDSKSEPFYYQFIKKGYDKLPGGYCDDYDSDLDHPSTGMRPALGVEFGVWFNENSQSSNVITGTVTYNYKGQTKTVDIGKVTIYNGN